MVPLNIEYDVEWAFCLLSLCLAPSPRAQLPDQPSRAC